MDELRKIPASWWTEVKVVGLASVTLLAGDTLLTATSAQNITLVLLRSWTTQKQNINIKLHPTTFPPPGVAYRLAFLITPIFSRQASLTRQAFLITPLHGARYKTGKNAYAKK